MKNEIIEIPKGTKFLSEYPEIIDKISDKCILDKVITGVGATTLFLDSNINKENIVLCSPRKTLIESKLKDKRVGKYIISYDSFNSKDTFQDKQKRLKQTLNSKINNDPIKILVCYDSFFSVKQVLNSLGILDSFRVIVDEFHCILGDSSFKPQIEKEFINELLDINKVCFLSATPINKGIREKIKIFKGIDYFRLEFSKDDLRILNIKSEILKKDQSFRKLMKKEYEEYLRKGYFRKKVINGKDYFSKELLIFCSNVKEIASIINYLGLTPENTDVICSEGSEKQLWEKTRKKVGFRPSTIREKGEVNKTFTFITKCSFEGSDFYSDNATTFVFGNSGVECMMIDISVDLRQIIGRQRLENNVFRNDIEIYYINPKESNISPKELREKKERLSKNIINFYNDLPDDEKDLYKDDFLYNDFQRNYVYVNPKKKLEFCDLAKLSEEFAEQKRDGITNEDIKILDISSTTYENDLLNLNEDRDLIKLNVLYESFQKELWFSNRLKIVCNFLDRFPTLEKMISQQVIQYKYISYWKVLGSDVCKANLYREDFLKDRFKDVCLVSREKEEIIKNFLIGKEYSKKEIKTKLGEIYSKIGISKTPKATELNEYFNLKIIKLKKTRENGFLIQSIK